MKRILLILTLALSITPVANVHSANFARRIVQKVRESRNAQVVAVIVAAVAVAKVYSYFNQGSGKKQKRRAGSGSDSGVRPASSVVIDIGDTSGSFENAERDSEIKRIEGMQPLEAFYAKLQSKWYGNSDLTMTYHLSCDKPYKPLSEYDSRTSQFCCDPESICEFAIKKGGILIPQEFVDWVESEKAAFGDEKVGKVREIFDGQKKHKAEKESDPSSSEAPASAAAAAARSVVDGGGASSSDKDAEAKQNAENAGNDSGAAAAKLDGSGVSVCVTEVSGDISAEDIASGSAPTKLAPAGDGSSQRSDASAGGVASGEKPSAPLAASADELNRHDPDINSKRIKLSDYRAGTLRSIDLQAVLAAGESAAPVDSERAAEIKMRNDKRAQRIAKRHHRRMSDRATALSPKRTAEIQESRETRAARATVAVAGQLPKDTQVRFRSAYQARIQGENQD